MTTATPKQSPPKDPRVFHPLGLLTLRIPEPLQVVEDAEYETALRNPDNGFFRCLTKEDGDKRVVWNRRSLPEINAAKQTFLDLIAKGMTPYRVGINGQRSAEVMKEFDPTAQEVIFIPMALVGGG